MGRGLHLLSPVERDRRGSVARYRSQVPAHRAQSLRRLLRRACAVLRRVRQHSRQGCLEGPLIMADYFGHSAQRSTPYAGKTYTAVAGADEYETVAASQTAQVL